MSATIESVHRAFRFPQDDLAEIDRRAKAYGLTRTRYVIDAALDRLKPAGTIDDRFQALEQRLERLEAATYG